jgi:hypothetical protein
MAHQRDRQSNRVTDRQLHSGHHNTDKTSFSKTFCGKNRPACVRIRSAPRPLGKGPSVSLVGRKVSTYWSKIIVVPGSSRLKTVSAREEEVHTLRAKWSSRKKRVIWQRSACNRKQSSAHNKNRSAEVSTMNQIGLHTS